MMQLFGVRAFCHLGMAKSSAPNAPAGRLFALFSDNAKMLIRPHGRDQISRNCYQEWARLAPRPGRGRDYFRTCGNCCTGGAQLAASLAAPAYCSSLSDRVLA